jgi:hypothetical protein
MFAFMVRTLTPSRGNNLQAPNAGPCLQLPQRRLEQHLHELLSVRPHTFFINGLRCRLPRAVEAL